MPPRNLLTILVALLVSLACYRQASHNRFASTVAEAMEQVRANYVQPVQQRTLFENAMEGMVAELDPYSSFIPPQSYKKWKEELDQEFGGIGVLIRPDAETQRPMVMSPIVDSPAYRAGIRAGDLLMSVNGHDTAGITHERVVKLVQGEPGTTVTIGVQPYGTDQVVEHRLQRAIVPIESVLGDVRLADGNWDFHLEELSNLGYVRVVSFGEQTSTELQNVLTELIPTIDGLLLDLRGNEGGLLTAAVETSDLFLSEGEIVREQGRDEQLLRSYRARPGNDLVPSDLPLVVLVDHFSASASEIVAACLQDHGRAVIAGGRSWGKGTVQRLIELEGGRSALRLTTATFSRPSGQNIHRHPQVEDNAEWGVRPDQELKVELDRDDYIAMLEARRDRDAVRLAPMTISGNATEDAATSASSAAVSGRSDSFRRDAQLQRAIDFLKKRIEKHQAQKGAA